MNEPEIVSALNRAVVSAPDDHTLRLQRAESLVQHGSATDSLREAVEMLDRDSLGKNQRMDSDGVLEHLRKGGR